MMHVGDGDDDDDDDRTKGEKIKCEFMNNRCQ